MDRKSRSVGHPTCTSQGAVTESRGTAWHLGLRGRVRTRGGSKPRMQGPPPHWSELCATAGVQAEVGLLWKGFRHQMEGQKRLMDPRGRSGILKPVPQLGGTFAEGSPGGTCSPLQEQDHFRQLRKLDKQLDPSVHPLTSW